MRRLFMISLVVSLGAAVLSCGKAKSESEAVPPAQVAATVNGEVITLNNVLKVAENFAKQGMQPDPATQGQTYEERLYYTVVDRLVEQQLVAQEAAKMGMEITPDRVAESMSQLKTMAGGEEAYTKLLADNGITPEDIERDTRMNLLMKEYYDDVVPSAPEVTPEEIQKFYAENPQLFGATPEVHARHILFRTQEGADDMTRAGILQKARDALDKAKKQNFADLAKKVSEDETTAPNGGDLGWFSRGQMVAAFDSAAFALKPGQVSGIVTTRYGYHIIKVEETRTRDAQTVDQVQDRIRQMAAQQKAQDFFQEKLADLRTQAQVEVKPPSTKTLAALSP